jgi:hypothetical protein
METAPFSSPSPGVPPYPWFCSLYQLQSDNIKWKIPEITIHKFKIVHF